VQQREEHENKVTMSIRQQYLHVLDLIGYYKPEEVFSEEDEAKVKKRLRALGYLD